MPTKITPPLIISPLQTHHTSLIILHGRGSTAEKFAEPLLTHLVAPLPSSSSSSSPKLSFQTHLPNTRFIFPTAPLRRAAAHNRALTHQWFDTWNIAKPDVKAELQIPGLKETCIMLKQLVEEEAREVGSGKVVLMGLSQGCAASLMTALVWGREELDIGGLVGLCGYLPLRGEMEFIVKECDEEDQGEEELDIFEVDDSEIDQTGEKGDRVLEWLREELQIGERGSGSKTPVIRSIPVFLGHGMEDDKVPSEMGRAAAEFLTRMDVSVDWRLYEGLGHWYSECMLRDAMVFLKSLGNCGGAQTDRDS